MISAFRTGWATRLEGIYRAIRLVANRFEVAAGLPDDQSPDMTSEISDVQFAVEQLGPDLAEIVKQYGDSTAPQDLRIPVLDALQKREALLPWAADWSAPRPNSEELEALSGLMQNLRTLVHWLRRDDSDPSDFPKSPNGG